MAQVPSPVSGTPELSFQPWDATGDNDAGKWKSVDQNSGPANMNGQASGDFESGNGWSQT